MTSIRHMDAAVPPPPAPRRLNADQVAAFESDGLLFLPGLFSAAEMAPLARLARDDARITDNTIEVIDSTGQGAELFGWSGVTDDLLGAYVRIARLVEATEDLLGGQAVYHWHSKLTFKRPGSEGGGTGTRTTARGTARAASDPRC